MSEARNEIQPDKDPYQTAAAELKQELSVSKIFCSPRYYLRS
jgi:hypothetical protein